MRVDKTLVRIKIDTKDARKINNLSKGIADVVGKVDNKIDKCKDTENASRMDNLYTNTIDIDKTDNSGTIDTIDADETE